MKCQVLFSGKNKKLISVCPLLKILPRALSIMKNILECCQINSFLYSKLCINNNNLASPDNRNSELNVALNSGQGSQNKLK